MKSSDAASYIYKLASQQVDLKELYEHILGSVSDGVHVIDRDGVVLLENAAAAEMLGWHDGALVGKNGHEAIHHHHADLREFPVSDCSVRAAIEDGQTRLVADEVFWRRDGTCFPVEYTVAPLRDRKGTVYGATVVFRDITKRKQNEMRLLHMAQYCPLTDLPNRALFAHRLKLAVALSRRYQTRIALLYIDLDKFKPVNDTYGHSAGDQLLCEAARRMKEMARASDAVARLGGDEFAMMLPSLNKPEDALLVGEKIRDMLSQPFELENCTVQISASIGIAVFPDHGENEEELTKSADQAMYLVKKRGRNQVILFDRNVAPHGHRQ